ncbi:MAG: hypothetical protein HC938_16780 [Nitrospira sp.]|nr:hypothetical protein [Nitrospira sp.]
MPARALARVPEIDEAPSDAGRLRLAVAAFLRREDGREKPSGEWRASVWYPDPAERRPCCDSIEVSPKNRQALYDHCCTRAHIAALYDVGPNDLRQAIREERPTPATIARQQSPSRGTAVEALFESSRKAQEMARQEVTREAERRSFPWFKSCLVGSTRERRRLSSRPSRRRSLNLAAFSWPSSLP